MGKTDPLSDFFPTRREAMRFLITRNARLTIFTNYTFVLSLIITLLYRKSLYKQKHIFLTCPDKATSKGCPISSKPQRVFKHGTTNWETFS